MMSLRGALFCDEAIPTERLHLFSEIDSFTEDCFAQNARNDMDVEL